MPTINYPQNPNTEAEIKEIVQNLKSNSKPVALENFESKNLIVSRPRMHFLNMSKNAISYQVLASHFRMRTKMKINYFSGNFSLAMEISDSQKEILNKIETKIREETQKHYSDLKKLNPQSHICLENLKLVKESCSGPKMYGKLYLQNDVSIAKFSKKKWKYKTRNGKST